VGGEKKARVAKQSSTALREYSARRNIPSPGATPPNPLSATSAQPSSNGTTTSADLHPARSARRKRFITLTLRPEDYELIRAEAERQGYRLRTFCRRAILEKVDASRKLPSAQELKTAYRALSRELRRWGVNLNQIAKRCNENRSVDREVLRKLEKIDKALEHIIEVVKP